MDATYQRSSVPSLSHIPVGALFQIPSTNLLLAGQGGLVSLFAVEKSTNTACLLHSLDILGTTVIHGFLSVTQKSRAHVIAAWGANIVQFMSLELEKDRWILSSNSGPFDCIDWVLSMCHVAKSHDDDKKGLLALLNTHNEVRILSYLASEDGVSVQMLPYEIERRSIMLYSGHISLIDGRLVVAAGTMFGQVLFEAYTVIVDSSPEIIQVQLAARDIFHDHEGSVFGVRILERRITIREKSYYRIASCSDDRTVRAYEIPDGLLTGPSADSESCRTGFMDFLALPTATPTVNRGWAMGHESRIWTVLWLESSESASRIMTFGEDATAQSWVVHYASNDDGLPEGTSTVLSNTDIFRFHAGKNIWAACIAAAPGGGLRIFTGGADGRVVEYVPACAATSDSLLTISQAQVSGMNSAVPEIGRDNHVRGLFASLAGKWSLDRSIVSQRPDYPSGSFVGEAVFTRREVTDNAYDSEMLYEEQGSLTLVSGMTFSARRNYVYRCQSNMITAWFVKPDAPTEVDYMFHQVEFGESWNNLCSAPEEHFNERATGYHLCVADHYNASYEFVPSEHGLDRWTLSYHVTGPQKEYVATSSFSRIAGPSESSQKQDKTDDRVKKSKGARLDSFRSYTWLTEAKSLITTDQGRVLTADIKRSSETGDQEQRLSLICHTQLPALFSYSLTCRLKPSVALITGGNGQLHIYLETNGAVEIQPLNVLAGSKVVSLLRVSDKAALVKQLGDSRLHMISFDDYYSPTRLIEASVSKSFLPTSTCLLDARTLAVGSRASGVSLWEVPSGSDDVLRALSACQERPVHGANAVTSIARLPNAKSGILFATTGRDGEIKVHRIVNQEGETETLHALKWPFGPSLEGLLIGSQITLWGFTGTDLVVWNYTHNMETMRVPCGNSHRNWAIKHNEGPRNNASTSVVWTQAGSCRFQKQETASHKLISSGGHGREIKAIATTEIEGKQLVATGAEDTDIKLFTIGSRNEDTTVQLQHRATLARHETGLTHLKFDGSWLFSAGGKEELLLWKIQSLPEPMGLGVLNKATLPKPENGLLRITDFCLFKDPATVTGGVDVAVAYSDSSIRVYSCTYDPPRFSLYAAGRYSERCLTCIDVLEDPLLTESPRMITASTDGNLILWKTASTSTCTKPSTSEIGDCSVIFTMKIHDSAIKAMHVQILGNGKAIIVSGGDDGAIGITLLQHQQNVDDYTSIRTRIPRAHAASVNAVTMIHSEPNRCLIVASTGSDQKVLIWKINLEADTELDVQRRCFPTKVADASGLVCLKDGSLVVAGVGAEVVAI